MTEDTEVAVEVIGTSAALEALNRSEVDMQITTAKKYPRSISRVREKILEIATCDQEVAESCFYAVPRDGKTITGPSVRLAEIVAASYQNLRCGARVIGEECGSIVCQGVCVDMENNVSANVEVRRRITNKRGQRYSDDMINTTANAGCSIAFRNAIFKVVPSAIFKDINNKIKRVGMGDERTLVDRRNAAIAFFEGKGIKKAAILAMLNRTRGDGQPEIRAVEDMTLEHLSVLNGIKNAVQDGDTTFEEAFSVHQEPASDPLAPGRHETRQRKPSPANATPPAQASAASVPEAAQPVAVEPERAAEQNAEPERPADIIPLEACDGYRELVKARARSQRMIERAIEEAAKNHDECMRLKSFGDIDHTDEAVCNLVLGQYRFIKDTAAGK